MGRADVADRNTEDRAAHLKRLEARDPEDKVCQGGKEILSKHLRNQKGVVSITCAKGQKKTASTWETWNKLLGTALSCSSQQQNCQDLHKWIKKIPLEVSDTKLKCQLNKEAPEIPLSEKNTESYGTNKACQVHTSHRGPISLPRPSQEALSNFTNIPSSSHRSSSRWTASRQ